MNHLLSSLAREIARHNIIRWSSFQNIPPYNTATKSDELEANVAAGKKILPDGEDQGQIAKSPILDKKLDKKLTTQLVETLTNKSYVFNLEIWFNPIPGDLKPKPIVDNPVDAKKGYAKVKPVEAIILDAEKRLAKAKPKVDSPKVAQAGYSKPLVDILLDAEEKRLHKAKPIVDNSLDAKNKYTKVKPVEDIILEAENRLSQAKPKVDIPKVAQARYSKPKPLVDIQLDAAEKRLAKAKPIVDIPLGAEEKRLHKAKPIVDISLNDEERNPKAKPVVGIQLAADEGEVKAKRDSVRRPKVRKYEQHAIFLKSPTRSKRYRKDHHDPHHSDI